MAEFVSSLVNLDKAVVGSYGTGREQRDFSRNPVGSFEYTGRFKGTTHPRSEWRDEIERQTREKCRLTDLWYHYKVILLNQANTNYCWVNAPAGCIMLKWAMMGNGVLSLSPASAGGPISGYRNVGGYGAQALKWGAENGYCATDLWPANAIQRSYYTEEAKANAKLHRFLDWEETDIGAFDQLVELVLYRHEPCFIGVPKWGHEVEVTEILALPNGKFGVAGPNSWGKYNTTGFYQVSESYISRFDCFGAPSIVP